MRQRDRCGWQGSSLLLGGLAVLMLLVFSTVVFFDAPTAVAQDDGEPAAAAAPAAATPAAPARKSTLRWMYDSLGIFYSLVFLSLSFTLVALFVMNLLTARRENVVPVALV